MNPMRSATEPKDDRPVQPEKRKTPLRCCCGSLLARLVPNGVELKCRRCKRQVIVPLASDAPM